MNILSCDVSKAVLAVYDGCGVREVDNCPGAIQELLGAHPGWDVVCEPTARFHLALVEAAVHSGHRVYLVNPKEARNYKDSLSFRAKTDALDARFLYEYVLRNSDLLRPYRPIERQLVELRELLGKRHTVIESRTALGQSLGADLSEEEGALLRAYDTVVQDIQRRIEAIARRYASYAIVRSIPGVGPISGAALVYVLESRGFDSREALVAFLGLDVRIRQSGKYRGLQKLTKRGDPVLRFLLCFAGRGLLISRIGKAKRLDLIAKGRKFPERMAIAARKILRVAFVLFKRNTVFDQQKWVWA
jgi:transposase